MSFEVKAALMACPDVHSAQASPVTTSKNQRPLSSGPSILSGISSRPTHLNTSNTKKAWARHCNDTPLLGRSSDRLDDFDDSLSSSSTSDTSPFAEGRERGPTSSDAANPEQMLGKRLGDPASQQLEGIVESHNNEAQRLAAPNLSAHSKPPFNMVPQDNPSHPSAKLEGEAGREKPQNDGRAVLSVQRPDLHYRSTITNPASQHVCRPCPPPRAYTSISQSHRASHTESDESEDSESGTLPRSDPFPPSARARAPRLSLQINDDSFTPLSGISQTSVTGRSSFGYARENGSALDTPSPISRSSLDFVFRSKTRTSVDPVSRAATVQAARQAFQAKEEAKTRKFEEQQMKAEEKQTRRKEKQHSRTSMRDDELQSPVPEDLPEKSSVSDGPHATTAPQPSPSQSTFKTWKSRSKNTWMLFIIWLRTRVFKLRRRVQKLR